MAPLRGRQSRAGGHRRRTPMARSTRSSIMTARARSPACCRTSTPRASRTPGWSTQAGVLASSAFRHQQQRRGRSVAPLRRRGPRGAHRVRPDRRRQARPVGALQGPAAMSRTRSRATPTATATSIPCGKAQAGNGRPPTFYRRGDRGRHGAPTRTARSGQAKRATIHGLSVRAIRNPILGSRMPGSFLPRSAERSSHGTSPQEPPRNTRCSHSPVSHARLSVGASV